VTDKPADVRSRLGDAEVEVRRRAIQDIPALPAPESCELLVSALGDDDWRVRKEAAVVAPRVEPRTAVVFVVARALAERENIGLRNAAVEALINIGPDAVPGAIDALSRLDADGRKLAVEVLAGAPTLAGMRTLARAADDRDVNVVVAIAEALGKAHLAGEEARELAKQTLTRLLTSEHRPVQLASLEALRELEADVPWSRLEPLTGDALLKRNAIAAAAGSQAPRALVALAEAVADPNASLAREAVVALGRSLEEAWGDDDALDVPTRVLRGADSARARLRGLAQDASDPIARSAAVLTLGLLRDPDDVPILVDALADDAVTDHAEAALHLFGQQAVEPLLVAGRTAAPSLRGATISMLPALAPADSEPLAAVREALQDPSPEVVAPALKSLAIVGTPADLSSVANLVGHADPKVSGAAQTALHAIAARHLDAARTRVPFAEPQDEGALATTILVDALARAGRTQVGDAELLASALTHREGIVRRAAVEALASVGGDAAAQAVTFSLADDDVSVALAAIRALGRLGRAEQLAALAATTKDPLRLGTVLRALRDADTERAIAAARPLLRSREPSIATAAVEVVGSVDFEGRVEALMSATGHDDHEVVKLALAQLAATKDERALAALAGAIEHPADVVRKYAAELLGSEGGGEGEVILRARLDRERSPEVRRAIMEALSVAR
jgi:HEAT repeat protein